jgi:NAD(P)-dependent dehydrogenase (short-subunit alcohol dehydrogenase family)
MRENQVVAITGAVGRIGSVFADSIVKNGGKVLLGDIAKEQGHKLERNLGVENALFFSEDLTIPENIDYFISEGLKKFRRLDAAVHCAYPTSNQWGTCFEELRPEGLKEDLFKQLGGAILLSQRMIHQFKKQGYGHLIHMSSIQGIATPKFEHYQSTEMVSPIEYSAIKSGIVSITRYLAKYCKGQNIRVNCISPGGILDNQPDSFLKHYRNSCNSKGMLDAGDITGTLLYLLSDQAKYVNGQNLVVDDGWTL